ncbi:MAG TPA: hypothetical protein VMI75_11945 [Polyangiaceae bacterium]|nr:hypothetical protein [Polyangiaceae bacterium]
MEWLAGYAASAGLRYAPEADERWLRAWEPYATLRVPLRYEHLLEGPALTVARFVLDGGASAWIAIAQDDRVRGRAAVTNDATRSFGDGPELITMPRARTGDAAFDAAFAVFAPSSDELGLAVTPGVRRVSLSWRTPVHFEVRPGGVVLAPVALRADAASLGWLLQAVATLTRKASGA